MSQHNESIYNIVPIKYTAPPKQPMHRSSISGTLPPTWSTFHLPSTSYPCLSNIDGNAVTKVVPDRDCRNLGKVTGSYKNYPDTFMKKMAKSYSVPGLSQVQRENPELLQPNHLKEHGGPKKTGPPKREDIPPMNLVTSKNFIVANAVETILAAPKKVSKEAKDYLRKDDYGRTPKYLSNIKQDINSEYDYIAQLNQEQYESSQPQVRGLDDSERLDMIGGLKAKWESVNTDYQGATHMTTLDTLGKRKRKEKNEAVLTQIEKDIEILNKRNLNVDMAM